METDPSASTDQPSSAPPLWRQRLGKVRHDLRNPLGEILGFTEFVIEDARERNLGGLLVELESIRQSANRMLAEVDHALSPNVSSTNADELSRLKQTLQQEAEKIAAAARALAARCDELQHVSLRDDLLRVGGSAKHLCDFAPSALEGLIELGSQVGPGKLDTLT